MKGIYIIALAAVAVPLVVRLLLEISKYISSDPKESNSLPTIPGKRIAIK
jgi:hypothetical protein